MTTLSPKKSADPLDLSSPGGTVLGMKKTHRGAKKRGLRDAHIKIYMTPKEVLAIERKANRRAMSVSSYARAVLLEAE